VGWESNGKSNSNGKKQIPCGNDRKKGKSKSNGNGKSKSKSKSNSNSNCQNAGISPLRRAKSRAAPVEMTGMWK
jgi:hypothetical protein